MPAIIQSMRHEIEVPYYPLDEFPPYEKIRRHRDPEYSGNSHKKPKFQPIFSAVAPDQVIIEMPNIDSLKEEFKPFGSLISLFVFNRGPQAVTRRVIRKLGPSAVSSDFKLNPHIEEIMLTASGMAFERLAHLYLNDKVKKESGEEKRVLDPGSPSRIFQSLRDFDGSINFVPDGIVMTNFPREAILSGLCEYKMSPHKDIDDLRMQVRLMTDFINRFSGQNLRINTKLDNYLKENHTEIKVDNKSNVNIVIPDNSFPNTRNISQDPRVNVYVAPFPRELPISLAIASLKDFGKVIL